MQLILLPTNNVEVSVNKNARKSFSFFPHFYFQASLLNESEKFCLCLSQQTSKIFIHAR
jgi:hypothetical protein